MIPPIRCSVIPIYTHDDKDVLVKVTNQWEEHSAWLAKAFSLNPDVLLKPQQVIINIVSNSSFGQLF